MNKKKMAITPLLAIALGLPLTPMASITIGNAYAADVSASFDTMTASVSNFSNGNKVSATDKVTFKVPKLDIPTTVQPRDRIYIKLPSYLKVQPDTAYTLKNPDGSNIGDIVSDVPNNQYVLNIADAVVNNTGQMAINNLAFTGIPNIGGADWPMNTAKPMSFTINGKTVNTGVSLTSAAFSTVNSGTLVNNDTTGGPAMQYTQSIVAKGNNVVGEANPLTGPYKVTMKAGDGLKFDCENMDIYGVPVYNGNYSTTIPGVIDNKTMTEVSPSINYASCNDSTLTFNTPKLTDSNNNPYDYVQFSPTLLVTPKAYAAMQKDFSVTSTVSGLDAKTNAAKTITNTATGNYVYTTAGKGNPDVGLKAFINDANPAAPTGRTVNGQDSDANDYPGVDLLAGTYTTSIVVQNKGYQDLTNVQVTDQDGKVIKSIALLRVGESATFTVNSNIVGNSEEGGEYNGNYYSVTADSANGSAFGSDGFNAAGYNKPNTNNINIKTAIGGQDANTAVNLNGGSYPVTYTIQNTGKYDATISSLTGIDGKAVSLGANTVVKAGSSVTINGPELSVVGGGKYGGNGTVSAKYNTYLPVTLGGPTAVETKSDPAYVNGTVKNPTVANDTVNTAYNTATTVDVLANDKADYGLTINAASLKLLNASNQQVTSFANNNGTFSVVNGKITFTPKSGVSGTTSAKYTVSDNKGVSSTGTVTVNVAAAPPAATVATAANDAVNTKYQTAVTITPTANDVATKGWNLSTLKLVNASNQQVTSLAVAGGTYTVSSGKIVFTPKAGFSGSAGAVKYTVKSNDNKVVTATINVNVDANPVQVVAKPDTGTAAYNKSASVYVLNNDTSTKGWNNASLRLIDPKTKAQVYQVTTNGGTYYMRKEGYIYFLPKVGFVGKAGPVTYSITSNDGKTVTSTVEVTVTGNTLGTLIKADEANIVDIPEDIVKTPVNNTPVKDNSDNTVKDVVITQSPAIKNAVRNNNSTAVSSSKTTATNTANDAVNKAINNKNVVKQVNKNDVRKKITELRNSKSDNSRIVKRNDVRKQIVNGPVVQTDMNSGNDTDVASLAGVGALTVLAGAVALRRKRK